MKLLTKTTLYFFAIMVFLLVLVGIYLFRQFSQQINERSDRELLTEEQAWIDYLQTGLESGRAFILKTREVSILPVNAPPEEYPLLENITETSPRSGIALPYRQLSQVVPIGNISYQVVIKKSQEQKLALVSNFTRTMLFVLAGLFCFMLIFNWAISQRLWAPFRQSLQKIRDTELSRIHTVNFENTNTLEFNELNQSLNGMRDKIYRDYVNMKEFTENAAHEMQTPIAVVQGKLELLLQDQHISEDQTQLIAESTEVLSRLARLNQGLLMLAKIENNQYQATDSISFTDLTNKYLRLFDELIKDKALRVETHFNGDYTARLHALLADSLITNLLGNAIKYNYPGGRIFIRVSPAGYRVSNTSERPQIASDKLFKRFNSSNVSDESSNGLGLAIARKIADTNGLALEYRYEDGMHSFEVSNQ